MALMFNRDTEIPVFVFFETKVVQEMHAMYLVRLTLQGMDRRTYRQMGR